MAVSWIFYKKIQNDRHRRSRGAWHWEGDLIAVSKNSYIATLVERHTRYVMLAKVPNKETETVINA